MRKLILLSSLLIFELSFTVAIAQDVQNLYVSLKGSDKNPGTMEKPFGSPEKGLEVALNTIKQHPGSSVNVNLREGVYHRKSFLQIDQPFKGEIIIRAYNGEKVIFHGGKKLDGNKFRLTSDKDILKTLLPEALGKVWQIDLKKEGITNFGVMKQHGFGKIPEPTPLELFINGQPQMLARYPNQGILKIGKVYDKGSVPRNGDQSNRGAEFGYEDDRILRWLNAKDIWLHGKFSNGYSDDYLKVERIDTQKRSLKMLQPHLYGVSSSIYINSEGERPGMNIRGFYALNLLEEIDYPGEYYVDREKGRLFIYSSSPLSLSEIEVSLIEVPFFVIKNSSDIKIEGISFTCARGMGIYMENCSNITIEKCNFYNLGTVGISFGHSLNGNREDFNLDGSPRQEAKNDGDFKNISIRNCKVYNTGTGGIIIEGGDRKTLTASNNLIYNTELYNTDRINTTFSPAIKLNGVGTVIRNCYIHDTRHQAIGFTGNDHLIEYCRFNNLCTSADDMGAIYTGRNPSARGTVIQYNYFSNIEPDDKASSMCGVYFDDGCGGMTVRKNFFYKVGNPGHYQNFGAIYFHGGHDNTISDNIFMDCVVAYGHQPWTDERWIKSLESPLIKEKISIEVDIMGDIYQKKYPELKDYLTKIGRRMNLVSNNLLIRSQSAQFGDLMLRRNITINDAGLTPELIDYKEVKKQLPSIDVFSFEKTGISTVVK